jgi:hypothetical protein
MRQGQIGRGGQRFFLQLPEKDVSPLHAEIGMRLGQGRQKPGAQSPRFRAALRFQQLQHPQGVIQNLSGFDAIN